MAEMKSRQLPGFGNWECCDEMPITRCFDYEGEAGASFFGEEDLFKVPVAMPVKYGYPYGGQSRRKVRQEGGAGVEKQHPKQGRRKTSMAVDEDLYKIPSELLYQKPKRKKLLRNLLSGCMSLNCIR